MRVRRQRFASCLNIALFCAGTLGLAVSAPARAEVVLNTGAATYSLQVRSYRDIPFRTTIRQEFDYSCGSAALATLLHFHYGRPIGEEEIFKAMYLAGDQEKIQKVGFSLLDMKTYLEQHGFKADGYRMTLDELQKSNTPAITVITIGPYKHFVVVKGVRDGRVLIGDPAQGLKTYPRADFEKMWNGIVFMIHDDRVDRIAFNRSEEWSPWARAPSGDRLDAQSLFGADTHVPTIYQVMQVTGLGSASQ